MSQATLERFYTAFQALDGAAMQDCYAADAHFEDEVFDLQGREAVGAMWRMLCDATRAKGADVWRLDYRVIDATHAHWDAHYRFSATGRMVLNRIDAECTFDAEGRILRHRDRFDFWAWSRQALGAPGWLLGWTPLLRAKVKAQAAKNLAAYRARSGA